MRRVKISGAVQNLGTSPRPAARGGWVGGLPPGVAASAISAAKKRASSPKKKLLLCE